MRLKGGSLEWPFIVMFLVFIGMFVIALVAGFYLRSLVSGPPVQVTTYTEYRWMNYLPSSVIFALKYSDDSWKAINELALYDSKQLVLMKSSDFVDYFSSLDPDRFSGVPLVSLESDLKMLENSFNDGSNVKREFYVIKDQQGLSLIYGLGSILSEVKEGQKAMVTIFPEDYPYKCSQKEVPVFSGKRENMRLNMVICCYDIRKCADYLPDPGRTECDTNDPCGVGPCMIVHPVGEERYCAENFPPVVEFFVRPERGSGADWRKAEGEISFSYGEGEEAKVAVMAVVKDDSSLMEVTFEYGDGSLVSFKPGSPPKECSCKVLDPSELEALYSPSPALASYKSGLSCTCSHTYEQGGGYNLRSKVWDERKNPVEGNVKVEVSIR